MKPATLACFAALCLIGLPAHAAPGDQPRTAQAGTERRAETPRAAPPEAGKVEPGRSEPTRPEAPRAEAQRPAQPGVRERRRRSSYAACNRASHQRDYRGGRRRRFLIRCRLGYERTRQPAPAGAPQVPGRRP